jgi:FdhD protein
MVRNDISTTRILRFRDKEATEAEDFLATEEPMEIRLISGSADNRAIKSLSVTMRTPGNDLELATGFLFTEGMIQSAADIQSISHCNDIICLDPENIVEVVFDEKVTFNWKNLERHFYATSSCGVCGKASIDAIKTSNMHLRSAKKDWTVSSELIYSLPDLLRKEQSVFESTGGLHASAIFDLQGKLLLLREDVGRHNALDKLIGAALQEGKMPLDEHILLLSGRASFELLQKAAMAGISLVVAVGAPSSLAVGIAEEFGITLIGFLRGRGFNVYTMMERVNKNQIHEGTP